MSSPKQRRKVPPSQLPEYNPFQGVSKVARDHAKRINEAVFELMIKPAQEPKPETINGLPIVALSPVELSEDAVEMALASIPSYRRCPLCWGRCRGVGLVYSKQGSTRYYKCKKTMTDHPPCGFTWTATVRVEVVRVEHRRVEMDGER